MSKAKKPAPAKPREVWLLESRDGDFLSSVTHETEKKAARFAVRVYGDPTLRPVKFVEEKRDGR